MTGKLEELKAARDAAYDAYEAYAYADAFEARDAAADAASAAWDAYDAAADAYEAERTHNEDYTQ